MDALTPRKIVEYLDHYIVGQRDAKKSVAVALRNRWRADNYLLIWPKKSARKIFFLSAPLG